MTVDWSVPIEAVHEDGYTLPVNAGSPDLDGDRHVCSSAGSKEDWIDGYHRQDGTSLLANDPWRIRNVAKPVRAPAEMLDRMEALVRRLSSGVSYPDDIVEARAIVAEMTPPVDPDLLAAREVLRGWSSDAAPESLVVEAVKLGRQLEREARHD